MIDDATLMAYADGELDAAARAEVEALMAADPTLRERVEAHHRLRTIVSGAYSGVADEPVPARLAATLKPEAEVISLAAARASKAPTARPRWRSWGAIAATLLVGVIAGRTIDVGLQPPITTRGGVLIARGALAHRLDTQLTSADTGIGLSFRNREGEYCRTFRTEGLAGLACRDEGDWNVRMAVAAAPSVGDYRMASSDMPSPIVEAVEASIAGEPLDAAQETAARDKGWRD